MQANVNPVKPVMGAEDFSLYSEGERSDLHVLAGNVEPRTARGGELPTEGRPPALHSSKYYPEPAPSIATGIRAMTAAVVKLLPPKH